MTVRDIVAAYLVANGYDGLCVYGCGCTIDDLMPCDCPADYYKPGHMAKCDCEGECDGERYHIEAGDVFSPEHPAFADQRTTTAACQQSRLE